MNRERKSMLYTFAAMLFVLLLMACANIGNPDGGPYDETPPKIVSTSPKFGDTKAKNVKKIVLEFDEIVKIDNPQEKVVASPPQIEQPEVEANGRKITITLQDSIKPNTTYTIDFADAITDNNEGNPLGDYAFTFSTGEKVDTFQVSGNVLDASNLEPIKGMLVGLYRLGGDDDNAEELHDSVFRTKPLERISRTDSRGHFVVKGLAPGKYRAFALNDQNQNYLYDQRSEMIAFSDRILSTSSRPDVRMDTLWHDSIHYISIDTVPYTHYYPDDIILTAFTTSIQDRYLLKSERPILEQFAIFFTAPSDTLPHLTGLNFDSSNAFLIDATPGNDTIKYWIKDSLIYNIDTLKMSLDYYATDTTGILVLKTDTLELTSKLTKAKIAKQLQEKMEEWAKEYTKKVKEERKVAKRLAEEAEEEKKEDNKEETSKEVKEEIAEETKAAKAESGKKKKKKKKDDDEEIVIPPLPEEFLDIKFSNSSSMDPDKNIDIEFAEPLDSIDYSKIHFTVKVDSTFASADYLLKQTPASIRKYRFYAEWEPDTTYMLEADTGAFVNIYGKRSEAFKRVIKVKDLDSYSTLFVVLQGADASAMVQLLDGSDKPVKTLKATDGKADFYFINPGIYYMRMFYDRNGNGVWDTGDYDEQRQPEEVFYYPEPLTLKAKWEITQEWNPTSRPLPKQKPSKITKQKPDKAKTSKSKNAERNSKSKK